MTTLLENEILRVTPTGEFIWHEDADRMIEEGNFSHSPAMPYILKALRKREWVGLTDEEARDISFNLPIKWTGHLQGAASIYDFARAIEAKLKEKNT